MGSGEFPWATFIDDVDALEQITQPRKWVPKPSQAATRKPLHTTFDLDEYI
jgi:hypothetical protein